MTPKRLQMLCELLPTTTIMAVLVNPTNAPATVETEVRQVQAAAHTLGLQMVHVLQASTERDLDSAFSTLIGLTVPTSLIGRADEIIE